MNEVRVSTITTNKTLWQGFQTPETKRPVHN
jgi:hypothetical protein